MTTAMPILESARLRIRPLTLDDVHDVHQTYLDAGWAEATPDDLAQRRRWLEWTVRSYVELAALRQPPYGDRAVELKATGMFVGCVGLVPLFCPFGQLPHYQAMGITHRHTLSPLTPVPSPT